MSSHAICNVCWDKRNPTRTITGACEGDLEVCCFCGDETCDGLFTPADPAEPKFCAHDGQRFLLRLPQIVTSAVLGKPVGWAQGRYVIDVQPIGFMYGTRDEARRWTKRDVETIRQIMPDGPDLIVEDAPPMGAKP